MLVYCITNRLNGKIYIGQTSGSLEHRWRQHVYLAGYGQSKMAIHHAIAKYGKEAFSLEELAAADSQEELDRLEIFFIEKLNSRLPYGYNVLPGGGNSGAKGRCKHGHLFLGKNVRVSTDGKRHCRLCEASRMQVKRDRLKQNSRVQCFAGVIQ